MSRVFTASSSIQALIDTTVGYSVTAEFANFPVSTFPTADSTTDSDTITFVNPCLAPFTFAPTTQTGPDSDKYTGNPITFNVNQFDITPSFCEVQYSCVSVSYSGVGASVLDCSYVTFDGVFNGDASDGVLTFTASSSQYIDGSLPPGGYTVTIKGVVSEATATTEVTATFDLVLDDPCDGPVSVTAVGLANQVVTIT